MDEVLDLILVDNEDPYTRALDLLEVVGSGKAATVLAHPTRPDLVVRISSFDDGGFAYAESFTHLASHPAHAPRLIDLVHVPSRDGGRWISIMERLEPCEDLLVRACAQVAAKLLDPGENGVASANEVALLRRRQPGFAAFMAAHRSDAWDDVFAGSFMHRDGVLILNDPANDFPDDDTLERMQARYDVRHRRLWIEPVRGLVPG